MSIDPVFPLPEPDFLWVHTLTYRIHTGASVVVDAEGHWVYGTATPVTFQGYLTAPNPTEFDRAAANAIRVDAVCLAPHGTAVTEESTITADAASGVYPFLQGTYTVSTIRPNPSHLRCLLTRLDGELPEHDPGLVVNALAQPDTIEGGY